MRSIFAAVVVLGKREKEKGIPLSPALSPGIGEEGVSALPLSPFPFHAVS
jgi:hypothetical protein